jgi:hypothetical protein
MKIRNALLALFTALLSLGMTVGCERKDVEEAVDGDDVGVIDGEDELDIISPDPEEAGDELPGVEPGQVPDASLTE